MSLELLVALAALTPRQREALIDRYPVGRSIPDIAATMGCSYGNVTNLLRAARVKLAPMLRVAA